jgi:hypothetical protein
LLSFIKNNWYDNIRNKIYLIIYQYLEKVRSQTPTQFGSAPLTDTLPIRSRTPLPIKTNNNIDQISVPIAQTEFSPDSTYTFDRETTLSRSARDIRPSNPPLLRSKTPGPEFDAVKSSSYRVDTMKPRSKTPTAYEFSSNTLHNRSEKLIYVNFFLFIYIFFF